MQRYMRLRPILIKKRRTKMNFSYDDSTRMLTGKHSSFVLHDDFFVLCDEDDISISDGSGPAYNINDKTFEFFETYNELKFVADRIFINNAAADSNISQLRYFIRSFYLLFFNPYRLKGKFIKPSRDILAATKHFLQILKTFSSIAPETVGPFIAIIGEINSHSLQYGQVLKRRSAKAQQSFEKHEAQEKALEPFFLIAYSSCPSDYKGGPEGPISEGFHKYEKEPGQKKLSYSTFRRLYLQWKKLHEVEEEQLKFRQKYNLPEFDPETGGLIYYQNPDDPDTIKKRDVKIFSK